jgi:hypothetical protein
MSNIVNLETLQRTRRAVRNDVPESGAVILLFTGIQYVRDEADLKMYEGTRKSQCFHAQPGRGGRTKRTASLRKTALKH